MFRLSYITHYTKKKKERWRYQETAKGKFLLPFWIFFSIHLKVNFLSLTHSDLLHASTVQVRHGFVTIWFPPSIILFCNSIIFIFKHFPFLVPPLVRMSFIPKVSQPLWIASTYYYSFLFVCSPTDNWCFFIFFFWFLTLWTTFQICFFFFLAYQVIPIFSESILTKNLFLCVLSDIRRRHKRSGVNFLDCTV